MAYGADVTEGLPYALSNPTGSINYSSNGESYDVGINGLPFFLYTTDEFPYHRQTAQYRKQQIDQSSEPGEQSITGWWVRAQSSFHKGDGIRFYDPSSGETVSHRFADSKGVNVWNKGQVTLLNSCDTGHYTTGAIPTTGIATGKTSQHLRSIKWAGINGALLRDEYDVDKVFPTITASISNKALTTNVATLTTSAAHGMTAGMEITVTGVDATFNGNYTITTVPTTTTFTYAKTATNVTSTAVSPVGTVTSNVINFIDYVSGTAFPVYAICDDGVNAYWITNSVAGGGKLAMYKKPLTGSSLSTADEVNMFTHASIVVANASMEYVKDRIVACINNVVYEISTTATVLPTALYTHPSTSQVYTSVTASGPAIYIAGFNGIQSTIQKFTLTSNGSMPTLTSASTAAEMPAGEVIHRIYYYLGYMMIGTSKGIRVATINDQDGSISYGPLIVETIQPVYDFAARDRFVWAAASVDGEPGTIRIDLGSEIEPLRFAYANDLYYDTTAGGTTSANLLHATTACAFLGDTNRLVYSTAYGSAVNGSTYFQSASTLMPTGYVTSGAIRYATLESKVFKTLKARIDNTYGAFKIESIDSANNPYVIGNFAEGDFTPEVNVSYPVGAQEYMSFRFTLVRLSTDATKGPVLSGYQLKALPSIPRQRLIQYPLSLFDHEQDSMGVQVGHEGSAFERMIELETLENAGDTVRIEDFRTGESYLGVIEELQFINRTPTDKRYTGFGGILQLTIRTI